MEITTTEYQAAITKIETARQEIEKALNSVNRGYAQHYSRESRDILISIDETITQLREDSDKVTT